MAEWLRRQTRNLLGKPAQVRILLATLFYYSPLSVSRQQPFAAGFRKYIVGGFACWTNIYWITFDLIAAPVTITCIRNMFQNLESNSRIESMVLGEFDVSSINLNERTLKNEYTIKVNAPEGHFSSPHIPEKVQEIENKKIATRNVYNSDTTGYDINRQLFSDEDLREAFNAIDINNDGCLTAQELSFFLKCLDQPHTPEEVQEMISMLSHDGKRVMMQDFKKIGRGKLPPFAAIKHPQQDDTIKQEVLVHIRETLLTQMDPDEFLEVKQQLQLSHENYEQEKARRQEYHQTMLQPVVEENGGMKLRSVQELTKKRSQYQKITMLNVDQAIEAVKHLKSDLVDLVDLAESLSITQFQAKLLFEKSRLSAREAIFDIILFSQKSNLKKMELIMNNRGRQDTLCLDDWVAVLSFMMGAEKKEFIRKRLQNVLKHRRIQLKGKFDKYFILQVMTQEYSLFTW